VTHEAKRFNLASIPVDVSAKLYMSAARAVVLPLFPILPYRVDYKMKVLLVHNSYQHPGGEDIVFDQERQLLERTGHSVVAYQKSNWEADRYSGLGRFQLAVETVWSKNSRQDFVRLLAREKPDVVHVHNTHLRISPSIFSACHDAGTPVVQTLHNYRLYCPAGTFFRNGQVCEECVDNSLWHGVVHGCYRDSRAATATVALALTVHRQRHTWTREVDYYIALTEFARGRFLRAGLPPEQVLVKPNFVHPDPGSQRNSEGRYALFVGRLSPEKRVRTVLEAWAQLRLPRIPLVIIGGGPSLEQLRSEGVRNGLSEITFRGQLPREEAIAVMHDARFLLFPSAWYENFPVTIAESFACGLPVICSRVGAMQEIVQDGRTGLHFDSGDAADLAAKVQWAWDHPQKLLCMGEEARREYELKYTAERNYPMLTSIYERAIRRKARARRANG
jgi:glycosyltransferase involved in cell wall biosynthesis